MIYLNDLYIAHSILSLNVADYICASSQQNVNGGSSLSTCTSTSSPMDVWLELHFKVQYGMQVKQFETSIKLLMYWSSNHIHHNFSNGFSNGLSNCHLSLL
jgi:hypothetical protein